MESIQLSITGMKCGGCVSTVEKILKNSDGIENVSVNLLTESAYFEITQKHLELEAVLENLKENGFPSKIYINDLKPLIIIPLPGKNRANVANEAWKNTLPNIGKFIYLPSARWPKPENNKSNKAKVSFFHWLFQLFFFL